MLGVDNSAPATGEKVCHSREDPDMGLKREGFSRPNEYNVCICAPSVSKSPANRLNKSR